ncbi:YkvA family protein [Spirosoma arcticum]
MATKGLVTRILTSIFFKRANIGALKYARNSKSLFNLIRDAVNKSGGLSGANVAAFREQLSVVTRLLKAYASGTYRQLPWKTLIRIIAVLIYFVSPIDILPDFLPIIGLTDDIALMLWLFSGMGDDIEKFRQWETHATTPEQQAPQRTGQQPLKTIRIG